jgi:hypothetical protein
MADQENSNVQDTPKKGIADLLAYIPKIAGIVSDANSIIKTASSMVGDLKELYQAKLRLGEFDAGAQDALKSGDTSQVEKNLGENSNRVLPQS